MLPLVLFSMPAAFLIAVPLTALAVRLGRRVGAMDSPGVAGHEKVLRKVPNVGGIPIAVAVLGPLLFGLLAVEVGGLDFIVRFMPSALDYADRISSEGLAWWSIVVGGLFMHLLGLFDDRRPLSPWLKLFIQVLMASLVVVVGGLRLITALDALGPPGVALSAVLTVVWIVMITNAFNFLDNMDGLSGGVAAIAAGVFMAATIINGQFFTAIAFGLICGGLLGFLVYNVPPARIFMGDGGSLLIGFLLATLTVRTTFIDASDPDFALGGAWYGVLMPVVVLAIPIYDLVAVSLLRISQGRSPMTGDQQHLSHRLRDLGMSSRRAVLVIWALAAATGVGGIVLGTLQPWQAAMVGAQTLAIIMVLALLETGARRGGRGSGEGRGE